MLYTQGNVPREIYLALIDHIEAGDYECADNFRFAPVDDVQALSDYDEKKDGGCCGSTDFEVKDEAGRIWQVGCNYGH